MEEYHEIGIGDGSLSHEEDDGPLNLKDGPSVNENVTCALFNKEPCNTSSGD